MKWAAIPALLLAGAAPAMAQPQPPTVQQQFGAASAARDVQNWPEALRQFEALEQRVRVPRTLAVVRVRKGTVLLELGRLEDAAAAIRAGLAGLPAGDESLALDRFLGLMTLGRIAEHDLDYPEALRHYRLAAALPVTDGERILVQRGIIQTLLFTDTDAALRAADAALAMAAAVAPGNHGLEGQLHTLKGRALLNLGRFAEARAELESALRLLGNLTERVDRADLIARSDLAIAALRAGDAAAARRYLAYTGAGRFSRGRIGYNKANQPPRCGPDIAPADVAVIELFVGAGGNVISAAPVYASRQGQAAILFARAAADWWFDPEVARGVPALFRSVVRIEVRCSNQPLPGDHVGDDEARTTGLAATDPALARVLAARANRPADALRAELALAAAPREMLPLLLLLGNHIQVGHSEREAALRRALPMAAPLRMPPFLLASIAIGIAVEHAAPAQPGGTYDELDFAAILALPEIAGSAEAAAFVRLDQAHYLFRRGRHDEAFTLAEAVRAAPGAAGGGLLRAQALELEISIRAAQGDAAGTAAAHAAMGPEAPRCGLSSRPRRTQASANDFPNTAMEWGFEGWAVNEVSVAADGHAAGSRTIMAYPPFIFGEATGRIAERNRYEPIYVADGTTCTLDRQAVAYRLPGD